MFVDTPNSGTAQIGAAGVLDLMGPKFAGDVSVDLVKSYRDDHHPGFQANSRIITTCEMLQELVNLKR